MVCVCVFRVFCCPQLEGAAFALLFLTFFFTLVLLYFWGQAKNDYNDFDWWVERWRRTQTLVWIQNDVI